MDTPARDELPAELRAFLYSCIDSIEQVEILMMLRMHDRGCTTRAVASALGLAEASARGHLETLTAQGLLHAQPGPEVTYRFSPKTPALARYADLLASHHAHARNAVLRFVATSSRRTKSFADAFKLRDTE
jgi:DNA-binding IclR family transcriptional regulator